VSARRPIACHECDLLQREVALLPGGVARCARCGATLYRRPKHEIDHTIAWSLAAAVLFVVANSFPVVTLDISGQQTSATLWGAVRTLHDQDMSAVAALVLGTAIVAPGAGIAGMLYVLAPLRLGRIAPGFTSLLRMIDHASPWGMIEVLMLGIIVSLVKLAHLAAVIPGIGLWSFAALMLVSIAAAASYDPHDLWARYDALRGAPGAGRAPAGAWA
jgi:paraquat-inducible protein A